MSADPRELAECLYEAFLEQKWLAWRRHRIDVALLCAHRSKEEQNNLPASVTRARFGQSYHNTRPALAFDLAVVMRRDRRGRPAAFDWESEYLYERLGLIGEELGLAWGGRFKGFKDLGHFQALSGPVPEELLGLEPRLIEKRAKEGLAARRDGRAGE